MTDSKKRSGKRGGKKRRGRLAAVGRALAGGRRGGGARNVRSDGFPRPGLARLTLKDGGDPMGEKETSKKEAPTEGGRREGVGGVEDGWRGERAIK